MPGVGVQVAPSTTGLDHKVLELQTAAEVGPTGMRLMLATPGRPVQFVGDGIHLRGHDCDESAYFGDGEID